MLKNPLPKILGTIHNNNINKHYVLSCAINFGINVPKSLYTNSKKELINFFNTHNSSIITKMNNVFRVSYGEGEKILALYTEIVTLDIINKLPDNFFPTLFQEKIEKEFEIHTFCIDNAFYSTAIFSQKSKVTSVDFRRLENNTSTRSIPYQLPQDLESKLLSLMKYLKLNTGSFDIIKSKNGDYFILEINPCGQFSISSVFCNYSIEKKIADFLKN